MFQKCFFYFLIAGLCTVAHAKQERFSVAASLVDGSPQQVKVIVTPLSGFKLNHAPTAPWRLTVKESPGLKPVQELLKKDLVKHEKEKSYFLIALKAKAEKKSVLKYKIVVPTCLVADESVCYRDEAEGTIGL